MEKFVFDVFQFSEYVEFKLLPFLFTFVTFSFFPPSSLRHFFCRNFSVLEVLRDEEFAPLKNGIDSSTDSPVTVRQALMNLHLKYITRAGGIVTDENNTIIQPQ